MYRTFNTIILIIKNMNKSCLYIGSYSDLKSVERLPFIQEWIFVESLPNTEGDLEEILLTLSRDDNENELLLQDKTFRNKYMLSRFRTDFEREGFLLFEDLHEDNLMIFKKNQTTLYFFYNTVFPTTKNSKLEEMFPKVDSIYVSGFNPIVNLTDLPKLDTLFVSDSTSLLPTDNNDIITFLYNNYVPKLKYVLVDRIFSDELIYCKNLLDCHHKSLESESYISYMEYMKSADEEEYLAMDRVITL